MNEIDLAYKHCESVTKKHAKNFYYAFRTLPHRKRRAIYAIYAFCRICDDIADGDIPLVDQKSQFSQMRKQLHESIEYPSNKLIFTALKDVVTIFNIPINYLEEIIQGVEMDLVNTRYETFEELLTYCYKVASVVGLICFEIFGYKNSVAKKYAIDLGIAMQLTNILRDIKEDYERGRIYIPQQEMLRFKYSDNDLGNGIINNSFRNLMRYQITRANCYFTSGIQLIPLMNTESRRCPSILHGVYRKILAKIERSDFNVFEKRIGLNTWEKLLLTTQIWTMNLILHAYLPKQ